MNTADTELFDALSDIERRVMDLQKKYSSLQSEHRLLQGQFESQKSLLIETQGRLSQQMATARSVSTAQERLEHEKNEWQKLWQSADDELKALRADNQKLKDNATLVQQRLSEMLSRIPEQTSANASATPTMAPSSLISSSSSDQEDNGATRSRLDSVLQPNNKDNAAKVHEAGDIDPFQNIFNDKTPEIEKPSPKENQAQSATSLNLVFTAPQFDLPKS